MMQMNTPPIKNIRVTVPVTPDVLALFQRLSHVSGKSVGRLMGEWLDSTHEGLEPFIKIVQGFKDAPKAAVEALQLRADALSELTTEVVNQAMFLQAQTETRGTELAKGGASPGSSVFTGAVGLTPPSSNTGGKGRKTPKKSVGGSN
jgi:hypothetical protein